MKNMRRHCSSKRRYRDESLRGSASPGTCITAVQNGGPSPANSPAHHSSSCMVSTLQALCWSFQGFI